MSKTIKYIFILLLAFTFSLTFCTADTTIVNDTDEPENETNNSKDNTSNESGEDKEESEEPDSIEYTVSIPKDYDYIARTTDVKRQIGGTCWAFTSVSLFEAECLRKGIVSDETEINLNEMYMVYYAYLEKARAYLERMGDNPLRQGGKDYDGTLILRKYGLVRQSDYQVKSTDFKKLLNKMKVHLNRTLDQYDDHEHMPDEAIDKALLGVRRILNDIMGEVPRSIWVDGDLITPKQYAEDILKLDADEYVTLTSFTHLPLYQYSELVLLDNWQHFDRYLNVTLKEFVSIVKSMCEKGYTGYICIDISEPNADLKDKGIIRLVEGQRLDDYREMALLRQKLFDSGETDEDHGMHLIGYDKDEQPGYDWFYLKNSWGTKYGWDGYMHMSEYYLKLKVLSIMVHRDVLNDFSHVLPE